MTDFKKYSLIDSSGRVLMTGVSQEVPEHIDCVLTLNEAAPDTNHYWCFDQKVWKDRPPSPNPSYVFNWESKNWEDQRTPETQWQLVRRQRDALLAQSDWTQLPDVPLATKETWAIYRQALRDVTLQPDPFNVVWPVAHG